MSAALLSGVAAAFALIGVVAPAGGSSATPAGDPVVGRDLYETGCSTCHGLSGEGTPLGPPLRNVGAAAADFYLSTGRMPLDEPRLQSERKRRRYGEAEIRHLVAYVASFGDGPAVPDVRPELGDLPLGNQLYTANCAACHNSAGSGGALGQAVFAPGLRQSSNLQIAEAIRVGPGAMPVFGPDTLDDHQVDSIVRYIRFLDRAGVRGGAPLGRVGPVPEGLVAWLAGLGLMVAVTLWIGTRD